MTQPAATPEPVTTQTDSPHVQIDYVIRRASDGWAAFSTNDENLARQVDACITLWPHTLHRRTSIVYEEPA